MPASAPLEKIPKLEPEDEDEDVAATVPSTEQVRGVKIWKLGSDEHHSFILWSAPTRSHCLELRYLFLEPPEKG